MNQLDATDMAKYLIEQLENELRKEPRQEKIEITRALAQLIVADLELLVEMDAKARLPTPAPPPKRIP